MTFTYQRRYRGKLQAVLLDWAGTTMDFGCIAPAVVFVEVFARKGVPITIEEARAPMGAHKRVHIQRITELDSVRKRWQEKHGRLPNDADIEAMFQVFVPLQLKCLSEYSAMIPGALDTVNALRKRGCKIGSTTGYTTEMMAINLKDAERQGYKPDSTVCASDVPAGRPYPYMCLQNVINLGVSPVEACVKSTTRARAWRKASMPACGRSASPSAATRSGCRSRIGRRCRRRNKSDGARAPIRACTSRARTTSPTASPISCPASTISRRGSPAANDLSRG
jgi:phosphonoacetaldehyde hydrolase